MLYESLRQSFLQSSVPEIVKGLQVTSAAMTSAQKELTTVLHNLSDSHGGVDRTVGGNRNTRLSRFCSDCGSNADANGGALVPNPESQANGTLIGNLKLQRQN